MNYTHELSPQSALQAKDTVTEAILDLLHDPHWEEEVLMFYVLPCWIKGS